MIINIAVNSCLAPVKSDVVSSPVRPCAALQSWRSLEPLLLSVGRVPSRWIVAAPGGGRLRAREFIDWVLRHANFSPDADC